jgi:Ca2+-binding EF-hand superfamily protein
LTHDVWACLKDDQIRSFSRVFRFSNKDSDGYLIRDEFLEALQLVGLVPTATEREPIVEGVPGPRITIEDFVAVLYFFLRGAESGDDLSRACLV